MDNRISLPQGKQQRWYERLHWGAFMLVLFVIAHACDGEIDSLRRSETSAEGCSSL
jgi:hypothetical protein